jgi:hypothetical protein
MKKVLGDVTSLNVTMLRAGVQAGGLDVMNVVPAKAEAGFDIRISPHMDPNEMKSKLDLWCEEVTQSTMGLPKGSYIFNITVRTGYSLLCFHSLPLVVLINLDDCTILQSGIFKNLLFSTITIDF